MIQPASDPLAAERDAFQAPGLHGGARVCDLGFAIVHGRALEVDHAHGLYGALKGACPELPGLAGLGIHPVRGILGGRPGELLLLPESEVRLRVPVSAVPGLLLSLNGRDLKVQGRRIYLGAGHPVPLRPSSALWARTVTLHFRDPLHAPARQQLERAIRDCCPGAEWRLLRPRTLRIHGRQILGFEMAVRKLDAPSSLRLLTEGLGGRRAFGCGVFVPFGLGPARRPGSDLA